MNDRIFKWNFGRKKEDATLSGQNGQPSPWLVTENFLPQPAKNG
jgi:hypothetical protein